jgi:hypothetical protein
LPRSEGQNKRIQPQILLIRNKEVNVFRKEEKVLQMWSAYYEKHFELQDATENDSGEESRVCVHWTVVPS